LHNKIASCRREIQTIKRLLPLLPPHHNLDRFVADNAPDAVADGFPLPVKLIHDIVTIDHRSLGYQIHHRGTNGAANQLRTIFLLTHCPTLFLLPIKKLAQIFQRAMALEMNLDDDR
jgi:hypothetical protein